MKQKREQDLELAQKVCNELKKGNKRSIEELWKRYNQIFTYSIEKVFQKINKNFLPDGIDSEDLIMNLWYKIIKDPNIICNFKGQSSLKTYLYKILLNSLKTYFRQKKTKESHDTDLFSNLSSKLVDIDEEGNKESELLDIIISKEADKDLLEKIHPYACSMNLSTRDKIQKVVRMALERLSIERAEEALLLKARILYGMTYEEFVEKEYKVEDAKEKQRIINRLKKRFERVKDRFKKEIIFCAEKEGIDIEEFGIYKKN